ncbi:MAG TPA: putative ABC exporter domain-containing protein [Opitutus sp.]|nr:putative ABC exporter domain-containing protein [Opitutus sp.]
MFGALLYLRLNTLRNQVLSRLRRLRQPKYLVGAIVGAAYFYFVIFRGTGRHPARGPRVTIPLNAGTMPHESMALILSLGALALLTVCVIMWLVPSRKPGLPFSEAETAFLFPAPVTRRTLVHYKLLSAQFSVLLQSVLFAAIFNNRGLVGGRALNVLVGWWLILTLVSLHYMGSSLTISRLIDRGVSNLRRRLAVLGVIAAAIGGTVALVWRELRAPTAADLAGFDSVVHWLAGVLDGGALHWLLLPFKLVIAPFLASGPRAFLLALGPALLLLALHYWWVVRLNVSFEEASLALAEKRGARRAARRAAAFRGVSAPAKSRAPAFKLADHGRAEFAFLWKNLLSAPPFLTPRVWLGGAGVIVIGTGVLHRLGPAQQATLTIAGIVALIVGAYAVALGPLVARLDLRNDLANSDVLKTYPLPGWRIVLGEILAPVAILTGIVWLALLLAACAFQPAGKFAVWLTPEVHITLAVCIAALTPPLVALQLLVPNAATILFPGWVQTVRTPGGGIDLMGQRLIFVFGQVFIIVIALLPAAATAALLVFVTQWLIGLAVAIVFATLVVISVIIGEVGCGVWWLGHRFERLDLSSELRP